MKRTEVIILVLLAMCVGSIPGSRRTAEAEEGQAAWEYKLVVWAPRKDPELDPKLAPFCKEVEVPELIRELGRDGWEMVDSGSVGLASNWFKRRTR